MKNGKSVLWLLAGAVLGAAAVYVFTKDDKDEIVDDIKDFAKKTKDTITEKLHKLSNMADKAAEKVDDTEVRY